MPWVCTAETQSSCIKQSWGLGAGNLSRYSISSVSSVEIPLSCKCSAIDVQSNSPHIKKSNSTLFSIDGVASFNNAFKRVLSSRGWTLLWIAYGLSGTAYLEKKYKDLVYKAYDYATGKFTKELTYCSCFVRKRTCNCASPASLSISMYCYSNRANNYRILFLL